MQETEKHIIDISDSPAALSVSKGLLVIKNGNEKHTVPFFDIAVLVVSNPAVTYTGAVLNRLCENGGIFIHCDERRMPSGMLLPLSGNHVQAERFAAQASVKVTVKKRLWKQVIKLKISAQARLLKDKTDDDNGLFYLSGRVASGDPANIEAQASRRYWKKLLGKKFKRVFKAEDENILLNYGYAILRSIVARALCASGLHPALGIHHHNKYNCFCLADDIMEPFRPVVDEIVFDILKKNGGSVELQRDIKAEIINRIISKRFKIAEENRNLFNVTAIAAASLASVFMGKRKDLILPEF